MTSPSTIVCPSEDGDWTGIPWVSNGRLRSPVFPEDELTNDEKEQLWQWLDNLLNELQRNTGDSARIKELVREFQQELAERLGQVPNRNLRFSNKQNYFGVPINSGALKALNTPIGAMSRNSSVELVKLRSRQPKEGLPKLLIIPEKLKITSQWGLKEKDIWIYDTTSLVSFNNIEEFTKKYKGEYLTKEDIFLDNFHFIKEENSLPGACLPKGTESITHSIQGKEQYITPILPINQKLLNYFTPEELTEEIIELQSINLDSQSGVRVKINLPLSGGNYLVTKDYPIEEKNAIGIKELPYLEVWPNFLAEGWHEYYTFYLVDNTEQRTFQVSFPDYVKAEIRSPNLKEDIKLQITHLNEFPSFLICQDPKIIDSKTKDNYKLGLILLKTPDTVGDRDPDETWTVGVDRGTSFTSVYYKSYRSVFPLTLPSLHLRVTRTEAKDTPRVSFLYDYFMSANEEKLPIATILTTKGNKGKERAIFDGRIYIPEDRKAFDPKNKDIKANLKWSKEPDEIRYKLLFFKALSTTNYS